MLDDLKYIHERDAQDALGIAQKQWRQLEHTYKVEFTKTNEIWKVVVAGMGGSALAADIAKVWPGPSVPMEVVRNYEIPRYVGKNTLFIASSYSGNTEETLAALEDAQKKKAQIVVIASGGKLAEIAKQNGYCLLALPTGLQPRMAVFYNFAAITQLLAKAELIEPSQLDELAKAANWLSQQLSNWLPTVAAKDNQAKKIAQELMGKSIVVYSGAKFFPVAYKWKINFNENAKHIAWCNQYPEFNHNEFLGWTEQPVQKPYSVIEIRSNLEHPRVQRRFAVTERLLSGKRPAPIVVEPQGETLLQQLLWTITLGDFVSLYLALLNGLNPTPVDLIEKLKKSLGT